jgi:hypothetical protein
VLFDRHREIGAAFDGGIVGDDDAFPPHDPTDAGDNSSRRHLAVIHAIGGKGRELQKRRARIEQQAHPLARQQFPAREMPASRLFSAALLDLAQFRAQIRNQSPHDRSIGAEPLGARIKRSGKDGHSPSLRAGL